MNFKVVFGSLVLIALSFSITTPEASAFGLRRTPASVDPTPTPVSTPAPTATPVVIATPTPDSSSGTLPNGAPSCVSTDPNKICIGLKLVSYTSAGVTVLGQLQAVTLVNEINQLWSSCNIAFQLEEYVAVNPSTYGFSFNMNWRTEGNSVRNTFNDNKTMLVVTAGVLSGSTIGVTQMPGAGIYGALIEQSFAQNAMTVAHELGHYMGLYHISNTTNLMSSYIGPNTAAVTQSQCTTARATNYQYWQSLMRH